MSFFMSWQAASQTAFASKCAPSLCIEICILPDPIVFKKTRLFSVFIAVVDKSLWINPQPPRIQLYPTTSFHVFQGIQHPKELHIDGAVDKFPVQPVVVIAGTNHK